MPITQAQLARTLNVSQVAVSLAFRKGHNRLSPETRQRILTAAKRLGYRPNHLASGLRGGRTSSVGMIWAFADPWAGDAIIALDLLERLQGYGFAVYQSQRSENLEVMCRQLDDLIARRADALVIQAIPDQLRHPELVERFDAFNAVVAVCREDVPEFAHDLLVHDRDRVICEVVDHLVAAGRRRIAMATSPEQESNPPKLKTFTARLRHHGLPEHPNEVIAIDCPTDPAEHGRLHMLAFRRQFPAGKPVPVDAIFCFNDNGAMCIMRELQDRGVRIPEDIAVVGFNNIELGQVWRPALATGDRMHKQVTQALDQMIQARIAEPDLPPQRRIVHMKFVWRESAGSVPAAALPRAVDPSAL